MNSEIKPLITVENLHKSYEMGEVTVNALIDANFEVFEGEFVVILGESGSGKSTLLNIVGGMDLPSSGTVTIDGEIITNYKDSQLTNYRRNKVGFVFQFYNLMANLTARENVELATEISQEPLDIDETMKAVKLYDRQDHFPSQMSGGEQQRISIARAIAKNPKILLCDEPTGALDFETGISILKLLRDVNTNLKKTIIVITHNVGIAEMANRVIVMRSGKLIENRINKEQIDPDSIRW